MERDSPAGFWVALAVVQHHLAVVREALELRSSFPAAANFDDDGPVVYITTKSGVFAPHGPTKATNGRPWDALSRAKAYRLRGYAMAYYAEGVSRLRIQSRSIRRFSATTDISSSS